MPLPHNVLTVLYMSLNFCYIIYTALAFRMPVMKIAKDSIWSITEGKRRVKQTCFRVDIGNVGKYISSRRPVNQKTDVYMTEADKALLENFLIKNHQTLGDLLTANNMEGSSIVSSLERLVSFGLIRRDWQKETELHTNALYSLTQEGHYIGKKLTSTGFKISAL